MLIRKGIMNNALPVSVSQRRVSVALEKQSYRNILYLWFSFFLSLGYFVILVPGILLGIVTLIIWIGAPILFGVVVLRGQFAAFERSLAIRWLGVTIAPLGAVGPKSASWWQGFQARLSNAMTWKTLAYLLLKFPLSICCFVFAIALPLASVVLMVVGLVLGLITVPFLALAEAVLHVRDPGRRLRCYLGFSLSAFGLNLVYLYVLNGLAWIQGQMARALLGMSDTALRLEAARAQAEQERMRAEQAERRRHELVANVSHELRAPVATIAGHLESLLLTTEEGAQVPPLETLQSYLGIAYTKHSV